MLHVQGWDAYNTDQDEEVDDGQGQEGQESQGPSQENQECQEGEESQKNRKEAEGQEALIQSVDNDPPQDAENADENTFKNKTEHEHNSPSPLPEGNVTSENEEGDSKNEPTKEQVDNIDSQSQSIEEKDGAKVERVPDGGEDGSKENPEEPSGNFMALDHFHCLVSHDKSTLGDIPTTKEIQKEEQPLTESDNHIEHPEQSFAQEDRSVDGSRGNDESYLYNSTNAADSLPADDAEQLHPVPNAEHIPEEPEQISDHAESEDRNGLEHVEYNEHENDLNFEIDVGPGDQITQPDAPDENTQGDKGVDDVKEDIGQTNEVRAQVSEENNFEQTQAVDETPQEHTHDRHTPEPSNHLLDIDEDLFRSPTAEAFEPSRLVDESTTEPETSDFTAHADQAKEGDPFVSHEDFETPDKANDASDVSEISSGEVVETDVPEEPPEQNCSPKSAKRSRTDDEPGDGEGSLPELKRHRSER